MLSAAGRFGDDMATSATACYCRRFEVLLKVPLKGAQHEDKPRRDGLGGMSAGLPVRSRSGTRGHKCRGSCGMELSAFAGGHLHQRLAISSFLS